MSIEELATMLGEQIMAARAEAWTEGYIARGYDGESDWPTTENPYRKVSA